MSNFFESSQLIKDENALIEKGIKHELVDALREAVTAAKEELGDNLPELTTRMNQSIEFILQLFDHHDVEFDAITKKLITKVFMKGEWYSFNEAEKCKAVGVIIVNIFENAEELLEQPSLTMG